LAVERVDDGQVCAAQVVAVVVLSRPQELEHRAVAHLVRWDLKVDRYLERRRLLRGGVGYVGARAQIEGEHIAVEAVRERVVQCDAHTRVGIRGCDVRAVRHRERPLDRDEAASNGDDPRPRHLASIGLPAGRTRVAVGRAAAATVCDCDRVVEAGQLVADRASAGDPVAVAIGWDDDVRARYRFNHHRMWLGDLDEQREQQLAHMYRYREMEVAA